MSVLYIRDSATGKFVPIKTIKGDKGDTGAVEGIEYWENAPRASGTASPGTSDLMARGDHVHPMPSASDVGARPDSWMPTAEEVGARANSWMPSASDVGAVSFTLLWENANKTSSFSSQTLDLGLSDYDMYLIIARYSNEIGGTTTAFVKTGYSTRLMGVGGSASPTESIRTVTYSSGALSIGSATKNGSADNNMLIPIFVYGIKGVNA